jgi:hypothetical protein
MYRLAIDGYVQSLKIIRQTLTTSYTQLTVFAIKEDSTTLLCYVCPINNYISSTLESISSIVLGFLFNIILSPSLCG